MTRLASDIREASKPIYCSACFNSQNVRHIDFDAACDRGYGNEEATKVTLDDLILCENCVKEGAELIGMTEENEKDRKIAELERRLDTSERLRAKEERYNETLEDLALQRGAKIDHRKKPRPSRKVEELV